MRAWIIAAGLTLMAANAGWAQVAPWSPTRAEPDPRFPRPESTQPTKNSPRPDYYLQPQEFPSANPAPPPGGTMVSASGAMWTSSPAGSLTAAPASPSMSAFSTGSAMMPIPDANAPAAEPAEPNLFAPTKFDTGAQKVCTGEGAQRVCK